MPSVTGASAMAMDRAEAGEAEELAQEEVPQGAPLLAPGGRSLGDARSRSRLRVATVAALLLAAGLCASAVGMASSREPSAGSALPDAELAGWLQLSESLGMAASEGFGSPLEAFEAKLNKSRDDWTPGEEAQFMHFKQKVAADQKRVIASGGSIATVMANAMQQATGAEESVEHTKPHIVGRRNLSVGRVEELYTFGAPGTAFDPLYDATRPDGCIPGLRTYTSGVRFAVGAGTPFKVVDPVAYICNGIGMKHALQDSLEALQANSLRTKISKCGSNLQEPKFDGYFWITGHLVYPKIVNWHKEAIEGTVSNKLAPNDLSLRRRLDTTADTVRTRVEKAELYAHFTFMNYKKTPMIIPDAPDWGWTLVGRACAATDVGPAAGVLGLTLSGKSHINNIARSFVDSCKDHTMLYQHNKSLECALVFEGSDDFDDWLANLDFASTQFCGLGRVHSGFRAKVLRMVGGIDYSQVIRPKFKHCSSVTVAGHSLGGAQAELFTACANRLLTAAEGHEGYNEYRLISFPVGTPQRMLSFHAEQAPGVFLRNRGTGMCMDASGTAATDYKTPIIMFECEFPGFAQDQQWVLSNGLLVNKRSQKCMAGSISGATLTQQTCNSADANLLWTVTPERFLMNKGSKLCVNEKLALSTCPFTDQKFELKANGQLVNTLSGLCVDIQRTQGPQGSDDMVLAECKAGDGVSWELAADGALRDTRSGRCAHFKPEEGRENRPTMMMGPCAAVGTDLTMMWWKQLPGGFLRNVRFGKCLDVVGHPGTAVGSKLAINACEDKSLDVPGLWTVMPDGFIRNVGSDEIRQYECITVEGQPWDSRKKAANGTKLVMQPCKLHTDQKWEITPTGFIKGNIGGRKCLDLVPSYVSPAGKLWLMNCAEWSEPALFMDMKWNVGSRGMQSELYRKCAGAGTPGGALELRNCSEAWQQVGGAWTVRPDGAIQAKDLCLDVMAPAMPGTPMPLVMKPCAKAPQGTSQEWDAMDNGFVRSRYHNLCTAVGQLPGHFDDAKSLLLKPCPQTTQRWRVLPSGQIQNALTGKCIDAMRNTTGSWWDLTEWPCENGRLLQQWEKVS